MTQDEKDTLIQILATLTILAPRLTEPFAGDIKACIADLKKLTTEKDNE